MGYAHAVTASRPHRLAGAAYLDVFCHAEAFGLADIHFKADVATGLRAVIAIHSTRLGPAIGGCRCVPYDSPASAVLDAMQLARVMSYKAAINDLPCGGGKSVLLRPPVFRDRPAYFESFGAFVDQLGGRYVAAVDSGTTVADMDAIARSTSHVGCTSVAGGGSGDPSPWTALGVRRGIEAAARVTLGRANLDGLHVVIQGAGRVGYHLARQLHDRGARLTVSDIDPAATERCQDEFAAAVVSPDRVYEVACDVFAPCALGGVIDPLTVPRLKACIIAGSANNPLAGEETAEELHRRGILCVPDYVINAGGLIQLVLHEPERVRERVLAIHDRLLAIFERSRAEGRPPIDVADAMAEKRLYGR